MMTFLAERFPPKISFGANGGPGFLTDIVITNGGVESRDQTRSMELGSWEVSHAARLPAAYKPLQAFFRLAGGRANTFRFKDWTDYTVAANEGKFVMLTSTTFQCVKRYTFGSQTFDRTIMLPVSPISVTGGTVASISYTTGIVTMTSGTPTAWTGEFDILARFDTDRMRAETIDRNPRDGLIIGWSSIPIVEVRG